MAVSVETQAGEYTDISDSQARRLIELAMSFLEEVDEDDPYANLNDDALRLKEEYEHVLGELG